MKIIRLIERIITDNYLIWAILLIGLFVKLSIADYGLPYLFHPDEPYILKDPFKIIYNYIHFDFSATTNLYFWLISFWYSLFYIFGLIAGQLHSFSDFQALLVSESSSVLFFGRMLSILLSLTGTGFLLFLIKRVTTDRILQFILGLTIILNPIEIISNLWIKFDPAVYCTFSILLYISYKYFIENVSSLRNRILLLSIIAVSVRIDLIAFLIAFIFIDFKMPFSIFNLKKFISSSWRPMIKGTICYMLITLLPVMLFYSHFSNTEVTSNIPIQKTFESAILSKISNGPGLVNLWETISENIKFYFINSTLITLGPLSIFLFLLYLIKQFASKFSRLFILISLIITLPILIYTFHAPHYFLLISVIVLVFGFLAISEIKNIKIRYALSLIQLVYIGSITIQLLYVINYESDTRILARNYILKTTTSNDLIAIEGYRNPGLVPPIDECPGVLLEKARIAQKYHLGTGETLILKAKQVEINSCRKILEVSTPKLYSNTEYENIWCIDYDPELLIRASPSYYVSPDNYFQKKSCNEYCKSLQSFYKLEKVFQYNFSDPRVKLAIKGENFFPTFYLNKKKK